MAISHNFPFKKNEKKKKKNRTLYFCVKDYPKKGGRVVEVILAKVVQLIYDPFQVIYTYFLKRVDY